MACTHKIMKGNLGRPRRGRGTPPHPLALQRRGWGNLGPKKIFLPVYKGNRSETMKCKWGGGAFGPSALLSLGKGDRKWEGGIGSGGWSDCLIPSVALATICRPDICLTFVWHLPDICKGWKMTISTHVKIFTQWLDSSGCIAWGLYAWKGQNNNGSVYWDENKRPNESKWRWWALLSKVDCKYRVWKSVKWSPPRRGWRRQSTRTFECLHTFCVWFKPPNLPNVLTNSCFSDLEK